MAISVIGGATVSAPQQYEQVFTSSGVWTKPTGVKTCELTIVGGGAGGATNTGQGGGAGGYYKTILDISATTSATITVGAGGTFAGLQTTVGGGATTFSTNNGLSITSNGGGSTATNALDGIQSQGTTYYPNQFGSLGITSGNQIPSVTGSSYTNAAALLGFGNGRYVMLPLANGGVNYPTTQIYHSTNGTTWSAGTNLATARVFSDVAYGNGIFVAVRPTAVAAATTVVTSSDGITWTETSVTMAADKIIFANGVFVTVGSTSGSQGTSFWSTNGTTWTQGTVTRTIQAAETSIWYGRPMWDGTKFIQIHSNTSYVGHVYQSTDGKAWTQLAVTGTNSNFVSGQFKDSFFANGVYLTTVGASSANTDQIWRSTNGTSWTQITGGNLKKLFKFAYLNGIYFSIGFDDSNLFNQVNWSEDGGLSWTTSAFLKDSAGTLTTSTTIGYLGSIVTNGTDMIIASDAKQGGSGGSGAGVWKLTGFKQLKPGRKGNSVASQGGAGEGSFPERYNATYNVAPLPGRGSVEGFSEGGPGDQLGTGGPTNYGGGGSGLTSNPASQKNGYQGAVILRWWA
jgi:hypothetical protein